ncbi:DUF1850 domain-containing protein [Rubellimicrobium roseum]|uniref:DUF1850 domain-containing protein n=1 Tax=Rubellimicrobium roseum TaxID=687525 RepID=A0A5C4N6N6_9RHOB|nr:DUF1850 domain-containing protein [Rubellimicrobium roseum]TNC60696.1 DUF1850 domain-containing protein [Rubellimicrobium roseum]
MSLCLTAGGVTLALAIETFSLIWAHSVERTDWREEWRVTEVGLVIESASIAGSGAGMEVPEGAVLRDGAWHYQPALPPQAEVIFADAGRETGDWRLCEGNVCRDVGDLVPSRGDQVTLRACGLSGMKLSEVSSAHASGRRPTK